MCINPNLVWVERGPKWEQQPVPCRQCWRCKKNRVNDYTARAMAEAQTSAHTCALTLTYAPRDDLADKILHPRHFQLFIKQLRNSGHRVRYLVAGEYGSLKDRAHFHAILFFTELAKPSGETLPAFYNPDHMADFKRSAPFCRLLPNRKITHIREWPHGHVVADWSATESAVRYVCKYLLADDKNNAWFSLSKKPPLGAEWFARKAALAVEYDTLPHSFEYLPPGGSRDKPFMMTGATRRDYLNAITQNPDDRPRMSEWVQKTFDKHHKARLIAEAEAMPVEYQLERLAERLAVLEKTADRAYAAQLRRDAWAEFISADLGWLAKHWGFDDVEEFKGWAEAGGLARAVAQIGNPA